MARRSDLPSNNSSPARVDSVGRGALSMGVSRVAGMGAGFVLLMLLTRRGEHDVGVFRTLITYMVIAESLALLGMHRWLATVIGTDLSKRGRHFAASTVWAITVAAILALIYIIIAHSNVYDASVSRGLELIAFTTIPCAALLVQQSALIGLGQSGRVGMLTIGEALGRATIGIALVLAGSDVLTVILLFGVVRWITAFVGFRMCKDAIGPLDWHKPFDELKRLRSIVPRFAGAMVCFLAMRYAAIVMLPSIASTEQAGLFGVTYQLMDLAMLVPTVLALSSTFAMARGASASTSHLRRSIGGMMMLVSLFMFPVAAMAIALAEPVLALLFGHRFLAAGTSLQLMMLVTIVMAIDQVLSQATVSDQRYSEDLICVALGALTAIGLIAVLGAKWGAAGTAAAFLCAMFITLLARTWLLRDLQVTRILVHVAWRPALSATIAGAATFLMVNGLPSSVDQRWSVLFAIPGAILYGVCYAAFGGFKRRSRQRLSHFLQRAG